MSGPEIFEIEAKALEELFSGTRCESCGRAAASVPDETWAKVGCGYFCAECIAAGYHLTHPSACRVS